MSRAGRLTDQVRLFYANVDSPIDELLVLSDGESLCGLYMQNGPKGRAIENKWAPADEPFADVKLQLQEYFDGARREFDLPLAPRGTPFQLAVWNALLRIPYGETRSYGELAQDLRRPTASRAVGAANGRNPISVIIPCHRVIGADGSLTGFGGGLERKQRLLSLEACSIARSAEKRLSRRPA
jgi:methylated-DNA-[protein]-cysteine S-methyltransferase